MTGRDFFLWQVRSFTVRINLELIARLNESLGARRNESNVELGGILLGQIIAPEEIEISGVEFVQSEHRRGVIYSLGLREQRSMSERVALLSRKSGPKPVGFFRTHLRRGLFLDQDDFSLMQEAFGHPSQISLLIRPEESGPSNAGIFFWEEGDIDRRQTNLPFPFDPAALRARGPIESVAAPPPRVAAPLRLPRVPVSWLAWAAATAAGALALGAVLPRLQLRPTVTVQTKPPAKKAKPAQPRPVQIAEAEPAPPPFVAPKPDEGQSEAPRKPVERLPIPLPEVAPAAPPRLIAAVIPPPPMVEPVAAKAIDPLPDPELPASRPAPVRPPEPARVSVSKPVTPAVHVAVSLEARQSSELKKVVSHVPLFGHLAHAEGGSDFSPARPNSQLEPRIPASLASDLSGLLDVDVRLTIDKHGLVTKSEILHGSGTQFASLAASNAGNASWEPAREGDRNVTSDVIVHYRFQSGQ